MMLILVPVIKICVVYRLSCCMEAMLGSWHFLCCIICPLLLLFPIYHILFFRGFVVVDVVGCLYFPTSLFSYCLALSAASCAYLLQPLPGGFSLEKLQRSKKDSDREI